MINPDDVGRERFSAWLPDRLVIHGDPDVYDVCAGTFYGFLIMDQEPDALELLGRLDPAIEAASLLLERFPFHPIMRMRCSGVHGRCYAAKPGGIGEARAAFERGLAEAARAEMPFYSMLLRADFACSVAFPAELAVLPGKLAYVGEPICALLEAPAQYATALQQNAIDPVAAAAAYREAEADREASA